MPTNTFSSSALGGSLQNMSYQFDSLGNLSSREDHLQQAKEVFGYDDLNRLTETITTYNVNGADLSVTAANTYDGHGNLRSKDSFAYLYGLEGDNPGTEHQVTQLNQNGVASDTLQYDANGNVTFAGQQRTLQWNSFNKPSHISKIEDSGYEQTVSYLYNTDHQRMLKVMKNTSTWYAAGGLFEHYKHYRTKRETHKYFLMINGQKIGYLLQAGKSGIIVSQRTTNDTGEADANQQRVNYTFQAFYLLNDHLGSAQVLVNASGQVLQNLSFSAWGERRAAGFDPNGTIPNFQVLLNSYALTHGFTGHEQDDFFGFINMKGRIYDAALGRFMSADPFVQAPNNTQSYNRYSYVLNNPLSYTDPSGYIADKILEGIRTIVAIATIIVAPHIGLPALIALNATTSFALTYAATGSFEAAFTSGFISGVTTGLSAGLAGTAKALTNPGLGRAIAHGVAQGTVSVLQGGKFKNGFISGFVGHIAKGAGTRLGFGELGTKQGITARTVIAATLGGLVSEHTGGKFANGAISAAFTHLFNAESSSKQEYIDSLARKVSARGYFINKAEADVIYTHNQNPDLRISIDASTLTVDIGHGKGWYRDTTNGGWSTWGATGGGDWFNSDFQVHGTVTVNTSGGAFQILSEQYDFEMKPWTTHPVRNMLTIIGTPPPSAIGTPFWVDYRNSPNVH